MLFLGVQRARNADLRQRRPAPLEKRLQVNMLVPCGLKVMNCRSVPCRDPDLAIRNRERFGCSHRHSQFKPRASAGESQPSMGDVVAQQVLRCNQLAGGHHLIALLFRHVKVCTIRRIGKTYLGTRYDNLLEAIDLAVRKWPRLFSRVAAAVEKRHW